MFTRVHTYESANAVVTQSFSTGTLGGLDHCWSSPSPPRREVQQMQLVLQAGGRLA